MLQSIGLANKSAKILLLGLDNAGKTTLLHMLRDNKMVQHKPTRNPTSEEFVMDRISLRTYDLGGHKEARKLWKEYFQSVDAIVYIVDAADQSRLEESKIELDALLCDPELETVPFLILGNKVDAPGALSEPMFRQGLNLVETSGKGSVQVAQTTRPMEVFMCSIADREGYQPAFKWLGQYLNE